MSAPRDPRVVARAVRAALTYDLLKPEWQRYVREHPGADPMTGHCYVATEAAYYLLMLVRRLSYPGSRRAHHALQRLRLHWTDAGVETALAQAADIRAKRRR